MYQPFFQLPEHECKKKNPFRNYELILLRPKDIEDRKAIIRDTKSGKEAEVAFLPQKLADRLKKYISDNPKVFWKNSDVEAMRWIDNLHG